MLATPQLFSFFLRVAPRPTSHRGPPRGPPRPSQNTLRGTAAGSAARIPTGGTPLRMPPIPTRRQPSAPPACPRSPIAMEAKHTCSAPAGQFTRAETPFPKPRSPVHFRPHHLATSSRPSWHNPNAPSPRGRGTAAMNPVASPAPPEGAYAKVRSPAHSCPIDANPGPTPRSSYPRTTSPTPSLPPCPPDTAPSQPLRAPPTPPPTPGRDRPTSESKPHRSPTATRTRTSRSAPAHLHDSHEHDTRCPHGPFRPNRRGI